MESGNLISKIKVEKNQLKSVTRYENIKADYFLEKVFNNLKKGKTLNIVKYNKNIKKRININTNDYKEYSEKYSSIEIEIKPVSNKYGKFINIKKEEEIYYHIYFNNNEEEIKRNYINEDEEIKIIRISEPYTSLPSPGPMARMPVSLRPALAITVPPVMVRLPPEKSLALHFRSPLPMPAPSLLP